MSVYWPTRIEKPRQPVVYGVFRVMFAALGLFVVMILAGMW